MYIKFVKVYEVISLRKIVEHLFLLLEFCICYKILSNFFLFV